MLHILSKSPWQCDINSILRMTKIGDDLILIQDGVLGSIEGNNFITTLTNSPAKVFALKEDIYARGISNKISDKICVINYTHFIDLTVKHVNQMSW